MRDAAKKLAYNRTYYATHKQAMDAKRREYYAQNREAVQERERERYHANKDARKATMKAWRTQNATAQNARRKRDYEAQKASDPAFLERKRIQSRRHYQATRLKRLKRCAEWARTHPDAKHASRIRRRMRLLAVQAISEKIDREAIIKRDKSICHICQKHVVRKDLTLDHLIPLFHGGSDTATNLAVAHRSCNARRGTGRLPAQLRMFG